MICVEKDVLICVMMLCLWYLIIDKIFFINLIGILECR